MTREEGLHGTAVQAFPRPTGAPAGPFGVRWVRRCGYDSPMNRHSPQLAPDHAHRPGAGRDAVTTGLLGS